MVVQGTDIALSFEVLLGILAITTFLVGFSTVRLQASLQEWRERGERVVDRLLDQNNNDDLLPLPSTLHTLTGSSKKLKVDAITWISLTATLLSACLFALVSAELWNSALGTERTVLTWLNVLVALILLAGVYDIAVVKYKARRESRQSPARLFAQLEVELRNWSRGAQQTYFSSGRIANLCSDFEELIPDWCWMTLIRYDLQRFHSDGKPQHSHVAFSADGLDVRVIPTWLVRLATFQFRSPREHIERGFLPVLLQPAVERIHRMSMDDLDDWYSLIAYVWSTALLQGTPLQSSVPLAPITKEQLHRINRFRRETDDALAEIALRCVQRLSSKSEQYSAEFRALIETFQLPGLEPLKWRRRVVKILLSGIRPIALRSE
jgi:hypothetical protein